MSGNSYFVRSVHLSIVADDVWLRVRLRDIQDKHRGNKYCMGPVISEGQRDALPWMDITFSTSYNMWHEWTSGWSSPMNKCTDRRKYAFPDPCVMVFFFFFHVVMEVDSQPNVISHYGQVYISQKACISRPMFIRFFCCFGGYYHLSKY